MKHKAFTANKKVTIQVLEGDYQGYYSSRIEDITDNSLILALPFMGTVPVPIGVGTRIAIFSPSKDAIYRIEGEVTRRQLEPLPVLSIITDGTVTRVQRRENVRIPITLSVIYILKGEDKVYQAYTRDISGGGTKLILSEPLRMRDIIQLRITLPSPETSISTEGEVVWVEIVENLVDNKIKRTPYAGVRFINMDDKEKERLVRFIFDYQRRLLKNGWRYD
jgi:c-di-GMP-binding flagellar brake protein YcgR